MTDLIISEKDRLTERLSDQFSKNVITVDEYEKMLDLVNKIETSRDIVIAEKMISTYSDMVTPQQPPSQSPYQAPYQSPYQAAEEEEKEVSRKGKKQEYVSIFSWREVTAAPVNGKAGTFTSIFSTIRVKIGNLPAGKTTLKTESIFGTVEILVPRNIKVTSNVDSIFGSTFLPNDENKFTDSFSPELHIKGEAIFGNVTVRRVD